MAATRTKPVKNEMDRALAEALYAIVEKVNDDLDTPTDGTSIGWAYHYENAAARLRAAATIADDLNARMMRQHETKAKE